MITLSPKARFLALAGDAGHSPSSRWTDLMLSTTFQDGAQAALAEFVVRLKAAGAVEATQNYYKLEGAREFLLTLMNLGEKEEPRKAPAMERMNPV